MKSFIFFMLIIGWIGSLVFVGNYQYTAGSVAKNAQWVEKENAQIKLANNEIVRLRNVIATAEKEKATALASAAQTYQEKENVAKTEHQKKLTDLRTNLLRMYDPGTSRQSTASQSTANTASAAHGSYDSQNSELSGEASQFLLDLTYEADEVTRQLGLCQSTVVAYQIPVPQ